MEPDAFVTVAEVAEMLKMNEQTVRNMIERGQLPAFHVGRRVRIRRDDLDEFTSRAPIEPKIAPPVAVAAPSAEEIVARGRLADASRTLVRASRANTDDPLITALLELSEAGGALADQLRSRAA